jgi:hypothetical protein
MYRILVAPLAKKLLRTLPDSLLSRIGHVIAKTADPTRHTLTVRRIAQT